MIFRSISVLLKRVVSTGLGRIRILGAASGMACRPSGTGMAFQPGGSLLKSRLAGAAGNSGVRARFSAVTGAGILDWQNAVVPQRNRLKMVTRIGPPSRKLLVSSSVAKSYSSRSKQYSGYGMVAFFCLRSKRGYR